MLKNLIVEKRKFYNGILLIFPFLLMWIMFGYTANTPDYLNYQRRFLYGTNEFGEWGFNLIISVIKRLGIKEFQDFIKIISLTLLSIIFCVIRKYAKKPFYVTFLFFLFPFLGFCSGLRFSIAYCIIIVAILVLIQEKQYSSVLFVLLIAVAFTFHYLSIFFYVLLLYKLPVKRSQNICFVLGMSVVLAVLTYTPFYSVVLGIMSGNSNKIMSNIAIHARFGMIIPITCQLFSFMIFLYAYRNMNSLKTKTKINADTLMKVNICELYVIPFYFINMNFMRLYMPFMFINTLYYSEIIFCDENKRGFGKRLYFLNLMQYVYLFITETLLKEYTWLPFINNNEFITPVLRFVEIII